MIQKDNDICKNCEHSNSTYKIVKYCLTCMYNPISKTEDNFKPIEDKGDCKSCSSYISDDQGESCKKNLILSCGQATRLQLPHWHRDNVWGDIKNIEFYTEYKRPDFSVVGGGYNYL